MLLVYLFIRNILPIIVTVKSLGESGHRHRPQDCQHADLPYILIDANMVSEMLNHILKHIQSLQKTSPCTAFLMLFHLE